MPTYEYECSICENIFERKQRFDEEPVAMCPQCGGKAKRILCSVPIIFKGSGFYCTDNRSHTSFSEEKKPHKGKQKGKEQVGGESTTTASH